MDARRQSPVGWGAGPATRDTFVFGQFRLDAAKRLVERDGVPIQLPARAFDILVALVERAGTVIGKNDLMAQVWPGLSVDEGSLRVHIAAFRKALGDRIAGSRYLITISGRGYCFVALVSRMCDASTFARAPVAEEAHNLPTRQIRLVGRGDIFDEIKDKLTTRRFVTIVGPGGIGKTTLAASVGHALLAEFPCRIRFIDLGTIRDGSLLPGIVASTRGVSAGSNDSIVAFLRKRRLLLILDSFQHVIDASTLTPSVGSRRLSKRPAK